MSTNLLTWEEAQRARENARERHLDAQSRAASTASYIANSVVRNPSRAVDIADLFRDELIVDQAAVHEAFSDWQDARVLCGRQAMVR